MVKTLGKQHFGAARALEIVHNEFDAVFRIGWCEFLNKLGTTQPFLYAFFFFLTSSKDMIARNRNTFTDIETTTT